MPHYSIEIWFGKEPTKVKLGQVIVQAETEEEAFKLAQQNTEHWPVGEVK